jgi:uncharacterized protein (DUF1697 family)
VETYVLLLRGINVGGHNRLPMADLTDLVSGLGLGDVRTYLQSGNVVCTGTGPPEIVAGTVSAAIREQRSLTVPVVARTGVEWGVLVAANPFVGDEEDPKKLHVTFLAGPPAPEGVAGLEAREPEFTPDRFAVVGPDVYLHFPGGYADAVLQNALLEKQLGQVATTRNWRTVTSLAELAGVA